MMMFFYYYIVFDLMKGYLNIMIFYMIRLRGRLRVVNLDMFLLCYWILDIIGY